MPSFFYDCFFLFIHFNWLVTHRHDGRRRFVAGDAILTSSRLIATRRGRNRTASGIGGRMDWAEEIRKDAVVVLFSFVQIVNAVAIFGKFA